ncbi:non-structural maintenance of chromosomes element 3 homolog [Andrena cerasifolii]|uniref:non-structural maintenance of chromosomes element 3 homolog n=1 Tax=Andrena cerasifolii TaxID=2819439 RepID=UPI004037F934
MGLPRKKSGLPEKKSLSQSTNRRTRSSISLSQPVPSTSTNSNASRVRQGHRYAEGPFSQRSQNSLPDPGISEEQNQLVSSLIRYLFGMGREKQAINKSRMMKAVFGGQGKHFHETLNKAKTHLSKIFGYQLMELEGNKYILVNQLENTLLHEYTLAAERRQQVLLFLVLTHIFMHQELCGEDLLWDFLTRLGIQCSDNHHDNYFGNVKHLVTEVFVDQKYLDKTVAEKTDVVKVEYRWGPRAEHEFSRRKSLEFVSQVYDGRQINSWPLQFQTMIAQEKPNNP